MLILQMAVEILSAEKTGSVKSEESSPPTASTSTSEISNLGPQLPPAAPLGDDHPAQMQNRPAASSSPTSSSPSTSSSASSPAVSSSLSNVNLNQSSISEENEKQHNLWRRPVQSFPIFQLKLVQWKAHLIAPCEFTIYIFNLM